MDRIEQAAEEIVNALLPGAYAERGITDEQILQEGRSIYGKVDGRAERYVHYVRERIARQVAVGDEAKEKVIPILRALITETLRPARHILLEYMDDPEAEEIATLQRVAEALRGEE